MSSLLGNRIRSTPLTASLLESSSEIACWPLEELTGNKEFQWGANEQESFEGLQRALVKNAVVASYSASMATEIFTDSSKDRMGACLVQEGKVVGWFSRG